MRVGIIINKKAGYADADDLEQKLRKSLFRCELKFYSPKAVQENKKVIQEIVDQGDEYLVVCGGDGTLNKTLGPLMSLKSAGKKLPALCIIPVGTANDLAHEMGLSMRVEQAAHSILSGGIKTIDVLEINASGRSEYMITNGGLGIPAETARQANHIRRWIKGKADDPKTSAFLKPMFKLGKKMVENMGSSIYELMLIREVSSWHSESWEVSIDVPGKTFFTTQAPFILINNQPSVGGKFTPAPFTSNTDGSFNVLLIQPTALLPQVKAVLGIRLGKVPNVGECPSFEAQVIKIKALKSPRSLTFFGDGEILHKNVDEITVRCVHPGLPIVTRGEP